MVAFLGLLQHGKVLVEHRLLRESNAVDTGQHLVLFVAAPISSGHGSELYRLYQPRIGKVRAAAEVGETAVRIERDGTVLQVADEFQDLDAMDDDFGILAGTDETATKLDLARAYVEMGDAEGARDILDEVIAEGTSAQQDTAREMIAQLG